MSNTFQHFNTLDVVILLPMYGWIWCISELISHACLCLYRNTRSIIGMGMSVRVINLFSHSHSINDHYTISHIWIYDSAKDYPQPIATINAKSPQVVQFGETH